MLEQYGFVYVWYDRKHKRYYIGCHWGFVDDGYICSSSWMKQAYKRRPADFSRKILTTNISTRQETYIQEQRWLNLVKPEELGERYYNLCKSVKNLWHQDEDIRLSVGEKISKKKTGIKLGPRPQNVRDKISAAKKGMIFSEEHKQKLSEARAGKLLSPERRAKISNGLKRAYSEGRRS